jgi:hypothetical protein
MSWWLLVCTTDFILDLPGLAALMAVKTVAWPAGQRD